MVQKSEDPESPSAHRPRGRPRSFDTEATLGEATRVFWQRGYAATSMDDLSQATGLNRPSLYGAFGDKHALYLQALRAYAAQADAAIAAAFEGRTVREGLARVYALAVKLYLPEGAPGRGCLLIGTAASEAPRDEAIREALGTALGGFTAAFEARLRRGMEEGELPPGTDAAMRAQVAAAVMHSMALRARAGDSRAALEALAAAGVELVLSPPGTAAP